MASAWVEPVVAAATSAVTTVMAAPPAVQASAAAAALLGTLLGGRAIFGGKRGGKRRTRTRATSIGSSSFMVAGTTDRKVLPNYDTIINIKVGLEPVPDMDRLKADFAAEIVPHLRFHAVPHESGMKVDWLVTRVDLDHHFVQHDVPTEAAAHTLVEHLSNALLRDKSKPWWEVHVIRVGKQPNGVMLIRIHHALADGISLVEAFCPLLRRANGEKLDLKALFNPRHMGAKGSKPNIVYRAIRGVGFAASFVIEALRVMGGAVLPGDKPNRFCHSQWPYSGPRIAIEFPTHKLSLIKALKEKAGKGTTVNDVEFALFAGAIRRFLKEHDAKSDVSRLQLRSLTPLALLEEADEQTKYHTTLRNLFTFVVNTLPTKQTSAAARLKASNGSWSRLKTSAAVPAAFFVHKLTSKLPLAMQRQTVIDLFSRHSVVFSNVPGPQETCFVAGSKVTAVHMIYPNFTPQVGILSMDGLVNMVVTMAPDREGLDLRQLLPRYFEDELRSLCDELGVSRDA